MLEIKKLHIAYGNQIVIENADLTFNIGTTCLIGQSGCGKSSILNALVHQIEFDASEYKYKNINLLQKDTTFLRRKVSYLTQNANFISDLTCFDNIRLFASFNNIKLTDHEILNYLKIVGLDIVTPKTYPDTLSGGEKQRLAIAQALAKMSDIILCDEITAALDGQTKIEIFNLLKELAKNHQKIIIMTSHDEEIYEQCDCIYHVEDKQVILEKVNDNDIENTTYEKESFNLIHVPKKIINKYILSKLDRQKMYSVLYSVITALVVSICAFLTFFTYAKLSQQQTILKRLCQNQLYIINQTIPARDGSSYTYYPDNRFFEDDIAANLSQINDISSIYPYYWISLVDPQTDKEGEIEITLSYENKDDKIITATGWPFDYSLKPYNKEQEFDKRMKVINPENVDYGVYINDIFFAMTGLNEDDLIGATLKTTVYPPVSFSEKSVETWMMDTDETYTTTHYEQSAIPIEIEIPIIGFVDFWYNEDWAHSFIYCPIDYMENIRQQAKDTYVLKENEPEWTPNAYIAFVNDLEKMEEVNIAIRNIDENIATGNKYTDNQAMYQQKRYVEITATVAVGVVLAAGTILSYVYGIYYYQKQQNDIYYFKRNGLLIEEFKQIIGMDCFYQIIINILSALPITILISYFGQIYLNMVRFGIISKESVIIIFLVVIYASLQTLISRIYYYRKIK